MKGESGSSADTKQKVPQGYSPADENAGSLTPFGMTKVYWEVIGYADLRAELLAKGVDGFIERNVLKRYWSRSDQELKILSLSHSR